MKPEAWMPRSRKEAERKSERYYVGRCMCEREHDECVRYTSNAGCVIKKRESHAAYTAMKKENPHKFTKDGGDVEGPRPSAGSHDTDETRRHNAATRGSRTYYAVEPCRRCNSTKRYLNDQCVQCTRERTMKTGNKRQRYDGDSTFKDTREYVFHIGG